MDLKPEYFAKGSEQGDGNIIRRSACGGKCGCVVMAANPNEQVRKNGNVRKERDGMGTWADGGYSSFQNEKGWEWGFFRGLK